VDAVTIEEVCKECGHIQIYGGEEGVDCALLTFFPKMEAANSFEILVSTIESTRCHNPNVIMFIQSGP
jgi:hypothetical protein